MEKDDYKDLFGPRKDQTHKLASKLDWDDFKKEYYDLDTKQKNFFENLNRKMEVYTKKLNSRT